MTISNPRINCCGFFSIASILCDKIGSHSDALAITTPPGRNFCPSFTYVGNPAPPRPTRPASSIRASGSLCVNRMYSFDCSAAGSTVTALSVTAVTLPLTLVKILLPILSAGFAASNCPRFTRSPSFTTTSAGAPICCCKGNTKFSKLYPPIQCQI